jgi:hypothetical protein
LALKYKDLRDGLVNSKTDQKGSSKNQGDGEQAQTDLKPSLLSLNQHNLGLIRSESSSSNQPTSSGRKFSRLPTFSRNTDTEQGLEETDTQKNPFSQSILPTIEQILQQDVEFEGSLSEEYIESKDSAKVTKDDREKRKNRDYVPNKESEHLSTNDLKKSLQKGFKNNESSCRNPQQLSEEGESMKYDPQHRVNEKNSSSRRPNQKSDRKHDDYAENDIEAPEEERSELQHDLTGELSDSSDQLGKNITPRKQKGSKAKDLAKQSSPRLEKKV